VRIFDIGQLLFFNEDVETTGDPEPVRYFYEKFQPVGFSNLRICVLLVYLVKHSEFQQYSEAMKLG
jgi:hypothetical protein